MFREQNMERTFRRQDGNTGVRSNVRIQSAAVLAQALLLALLLALILLLGSCEGSAGKRRTAPRVMPESCTLGSTYTPAPGEVAVAPVNAAFTTFDVTIPDPGFPIESIGIALVGTNPNLKLIEHGMFPDFLGGTYHITGPGGQAPLSFATLDGSAYPFSLFNNQAPALFFPNNGNSGNGPLSPGVYTFPIAGLDAMGYFLKADTFQPYVYYQTQGPASRGLSVNIWVATGVGAGITDAATALADPEVDGALTILQQIYASAEASVALSTSVNVIPSSYTGLYSIAQLDAMMAGYPENCTHDGVNIFVVGQIGVPGYPAGVLGFSSGLPGPFSLQGTIVSGVVVEYQGDGTGQMLGAIMSHELGHFLGLFHTSQTNEGLTDIRGYDPVGDTAQCTSFELGLPGGPANCPDAANLMFPIAIWPSFPALTPDQGRVLRLNPATR